jgi:hypothetical protein
VGPRHALHVAAGEIAGLDFSDGGAVLAGEVADALAARQPVRAADGIAFRGFEETARRLSLTAGNGDLAQMRVGQQELLAVRRRLGGPAVRDLLDGSGQDRDTSDDRFLANVSRPAGEQPGPILGP